MRTMRAEPDTHDEGGPRRDRPRLTLPTTLWAVIGDYRATRNPIRCVAWLPAVSVTVSSIR
jgi:hypothetical protein